MDGNGPEYRRWSVAAILCVPLLLMALPAGAAGSGSTDGPTAPGGDWTEPEYREAGDIAVFGGPGAYVGAAGVADVQEGDVAVIPGFDLMVNAHLGNNVALTGRVGASTEGTVVDVPALGGVRLQFPFGHSTVAFGPEAGASWVMPVDGDTPEVDEHSGAIGTGAFRASFEYTFEEGWTVGADASANHFFGYGTLGRATLKLGYEF